MRGDGVRRIYKFSFLILILVSFIFVNGCSGQTPSFLKIVHWKQKETPVDLAVDHYEQGQKYEAAGNREKAIEEFETAQRISPRPIVYYKLGLLYAAKGQYDLARIDFQKAVDMSPTFEEAKKELATLPSKPSSVPPVSADTTKK